MSKWPDEYTCGGCGRAVPCRHCPEGSPTVNESKDTNCAFEFETTLERRRCGLERGHDCHNGGVVPGAPTHDFVAPKPTEATDELVARLESACERKPYRFGLNGETVVDYTKAAHPALFWDAAERIKRLRRVIELAEIHARASGDAYFADTILAALKDAEANKR